MLEATATIIAGVLSGLIGGTIAAWGAWYAVKVGIKAGVKDLEETELRRQRIACVINLYGLRYVLSAGPVQVQRDEDRTQFMFEMGRAAALFAHDVEIQKKLRDFYAAVQATPKPEDLSHAAASERSTNLLVGIIKEMSRSVNFPIQNLSDTDVRATFTLPLVNPMGGPIIINNLQAPQPSANPNASPPRQ